jgi:ADP-ribose pyrophosphatase YjhB (NUDIX family)
MNLLTSAVAAVIADPAGRILLCQQSQGRRLWGLPGGKIRQNESPLHAAVRDIREQVGADVTLIDLVGLYHLTDGKPPADSVDSADLPDVLMHVFRARVDGEITLNARGRICRLSWHDQAALPEPMMATARTALDDVVAGRAGVLRKVHRQPESETSQEAEPEPEPLSR